MSAPRKIWAHGLCMGALGKASTSVASYRHGSWETRHGDANYASLYHHDDVVRELVEALDDMADLFSADNALKRGTHLNATLCRARAALAKIAQEDQR